MNNLPRGVKQQRPGREWNSRSLDRKSDALPLHHIATPLKWPTPGANLGLPRPGNQSTGSFQSYLHLHSEDSNLSVLIFYQWLWLCTLVFVEIRFIWCRYRPSSVNFERFFSGPPCRKANRRLTYAKPAAWSREKDREWGQRRETRAQEMADIDRLIQWVPQLQSHGV